MFGQIAKDFRAVFERDPAARKGALGAVEVVLCYPGLHALALHRISHYLYSRMGLRLIPRMISSAGRFLTGIEIHPGATIGEGFFIDHGMGVVIGETAVIGGNVTIYQGVTLGGTGKETGKRHPTIGSYVVIGAGAIVLGNITIGDNCVIGAGSVVLDPVPNDCTVVGVPGRVVRREGEKVPSVHLDHRNLPDPIAERLSHIQEEINSLEQHIKCYKDECVHFQKHKKAASSKDASKDSSENG